VVFEPIGIPVDHPLLASSASLFLTSPVETYPPPKPKRTPHVRKRAQQHQRLRDFRRDQQVFEPLRQCRIGPVGLYSLFLIISNPIFFMILSIDLL